MQMQGINKKLTSFTSVGDRDLWRWRFISSWELDDSELGEDYTMYIKFSFSTSFLLSSYG
jgi:hypothetical protein